MEPPAIWSHFESLKDPRVERTRRQQLIDIVMISVLAVVAGADGWSDIVQFAEDRQDWFKTFLELPAGIPCDDTFRRVFAALDPVKFQAGFLSWAKCLVGSTEGQLVAISRKADYILSLKENQPSLHREVQEFFASAESDGYRDVLLQLPAAAAGCYSRAACGGGWLLLQSCLRRRLLLLAQMAHSARLSCGCPV